MSYAQGYRHAIANKLREITGVHAGGRCAICGADLDIGSYEAIREYCEGPCREVARYIRKLERQLSHKEP